MAKEQAKKHPSVQISANSLMFASLYAYEKLKELFLLPGTHKINLELRTKNATHRFIGITPRILNSYKPIPSPDHWPKRWREIKAYSGFVGHLASFTIK